MPAVHRSGELLVAVASGGVPRACRRSSLSAALISELVALHVTLTISVLVILLIAKAGVIAAVRMFVVAVLRRPVAMAGRSIVPSVVETVLIPKLRGLVLSIGPGTWPLNASVFTETPGPMSIETRSIRRL